MRNTLRIQSLTNLLLIVFLCVLFTTYGKGQDSKEHDDIKITWAEKLGYPIGAKVIMLHADDAGMCEEANIAVMELLEKKYIQSTALMAPCPAAIDLIKWAIDHPDLDIGLHLTLTSEWKTYRWGPITDPADVPGLIDPEGMFWHDVPQVVQHASAEEVEKEILAKVPEGQKESFSLLMKAAQKAGYWSEDHGYYCDLYIGAIGRWILTEFARRFTEAGCIDDPEDIHYLHPHEIRKAAAEAEIGPDRDGFTRLGGSDTEADRLLGGARREGR